MAIEVMANRIAITGVPKAEILVWVEAHYPDVNGILQKLHPLRWKGSVFEYQATVLYLLIRGYDFPGSNILEIGTYYGYTAAVMAEAAPQAHILTLNSTAWEYDKAVENLKTYPNIEVKCASSWDYLEVYAGPPFCFIFVDGDHKQVARDLPWWDRLEPGGVMLFHDYSPSEAARACPPVYRVMEVLKSAREPDILVVDDELIGMIGWRKKAGEKLCLPETR
jgi:predicted O-methyltransferase YrrM